MNIQDFTIEGCNRFALAGIGKIAMQPNSALQVIIGTNGCGKSTLLNYLSMPLPVEPSAFSKGSQISYTFSHKGSNYKVAAKFHPGAKYYFEKDSQVLNDWGTGMVQKELLKEHLGIDNKFKQLFTSSQKFHEMNPSARREWFIQACDTDYTYALSIHTRLKDRLRDIQGALKLAKKRHVIEIEKLFKSEDIQQAQTQAKYLQAYLSLLIEYRQPLEMTHEQWVDKIEDIRSTYKTNIDKINRLYSTLKGYTQRHTPSLKSKISSIQDDISATQALMRVSAQRLDTLTRQLELLGNTEQKNTQQLAVEIQELKTQLYELGTQLIVDLQGVDPYQAWTVYLNMRDDMFELYSTLPDNTEGMYSRQKLDQAIEQEGQTGAAIFNFDRVLMTLSSDLSHMNKHKEDDQIQCPQCQHKFSVVYSEIKVKEIASKIEDYTAKITALKAKQTQLKEYITQATKVEQTYRLILNMQKAAPMLAAYWGWLSGFKVLANPQNIATRINEITKDLELQKKYWSLNDQLTTKTKQLDALKSAGIQDTLTLKKEHDRCEQEYSSLVHRLESRKKMLTHYKKILESVQECSRLMDGLSQLEDRHTTALEGCREDIRRRYYNDTVRSVQSLLGAKEYLLTQANNQISVVKSIDDQIHQLTEEEKSVALAVKILSPTDGLIAKAMTGFIENVVTQMNEILARIFTYKLEILPCSLQDEGSSVELDYKFPVMVQCEKVPDVSELSRGQAEMVDFAFLVTAMTVMGKNDFPLILDEIGSALDVVHRTRFVNVLKELMDEAVYSQVFLVSHDYTQYTSIPADYLVMDSTNVITPSQYNQHAQIETV